LFDTLNPFDSGYLDVEPPHRLYWEQCGKQGGAPVVFLHGGPGSGCSATHRRFFDPGFYRAVLFDQRGAGRSRPFASIEHNTTPALVADIERLRTRLGIEKWLVFGGSWGSTLALAYAEAHPERVLGLVLRGIFLGRPHEIDWFLNGMGTIFPEAYARFVGHLPEAERATLLDSYIARLNHPAPDVHLAAARAWAGYEGSCSTLLPGPAGASASGEDRMALGLSRIEAHYMKHGLFLPPNALLANIGRIRHLPCAIVQGRYDIVCPATTAYDLAQAWPEAEFKIVPAAGHSALEPPIRDELVAALERMKTAIAW
jgi:proline iminopeptidase